jgi:hypothetical protein
MMSYALAIATAASALALLPAASAVGPYLPAGEGPVAAENVSYFTRLGSSTTMVKATNGAAIRTATLHGGWGIPLVTLNGQTGGLSPDGRILVLSDAVRGFNGRLRLRSGFEVIDTRTLAVRHAISLNGDYSYDALSPNGRWLYLIHHVSAPGNPSQPSNGFRYQVQAYDLHAAKLLRGVIADKRQAGWLMSGMPVARATNPRGNWVYTLSQSGDNYPFVHALDTVHRTAVCIGLPWRWSDAQGIGTAKLSLQGATLKIEGGAVTQKRFLLDTRTFRVAAAS